MKWLHSKAECKAATDVSDVDVAATGNITGDLRVAKRWLTERRDAERSTLQEVLGPIVTNAREQAWNEIAPLRSNK